MKLFNLAMLYVLFSTSLSAKFVGIPIVQTAPEEKPESKIDEPELDNSTDLSYYGLRAGVDNDDDLWLLAQLYTNAAKRSPWQAYKLKNVVLSSNLDNKSKANLRAAILSGKLSSQTDFTSEDLSELKNILTKAHHLSLNITKSLLMAIKLAKKYTNINQAAEFKHIRLTLKNYLLKTMLAESNKNQL